MVNIRYAGVSFVRSDWFLLSGATESFCWNIFASRIKMEDLRTVIRHMSRSRVKRKAPLRVLTVRSLSQWP